MSDHSLIIKLGLDTADSKKRVTEINKELKNLDKQIGQLDTSTDSFEDNMSNMAKKIDINKLQDGVNSLSKAVGLFSDLFANRNTTNTNTYKPRAVYRRFED